VRGQRHAPAALYQLGKTRYPLYRRLGGPQGRSGQVRKISLPPGFDPQTVQPIASCYTNYTTWPYGKGNNNHKFLVMLFTDPLCIQFIQVQILIILTLPSITSNFHNIRMFIYVHTYTTFHTQFVSRPICFIQLHTEFHTFFQQCNISTNNLKVICKASSFIFHTHSHLTK
jgi:hypothetical protein